MNTVLSDLSAAMAARVELAGSAVVRVNGRRGVPASGIIWSGDGEIVTASHVVRREEDMRVGLPDGREVDAKLIGRDHAADIAVLRASATGLKAPTWLPIDEARVGQLVLALGRPGRRKAGWSTDTCRPMSSCTPASPVGRSSAPTAGLWA
jgi:serine protease DegQ